MKLSDSRLVRFSYEEAPVKEIWPQRSISHHFRQLRLLPGSRRKLKQTCWTKSPTTPEITWPLISGISHRQSLVQPKKRLWDLHIKSTFAAQKYRWHVRYICKTNFLLLTLFRFIALVVDCLPSERLLFLVSKMRLMRYNGYVS